MPGITFSAVERNLGSVFRLLPERAWVLAWRATIDFELVPPPDSVELVEALYRFADDGDEIPRTLVQELVDLDPQAIDGELRGFEPGADRPEFILRCVRGDEWDIEATDPDELALIAERVAGARPLEGPTL